MSLIAILEALVETGTTPEQMLAVARRHEAQRDAKIAERREKDAERKRNERVRNGPAESRGQGVTSAESAKPSPHVGERAQVVTLTSSLRSEALPPEKPSVSTPKGQKTNGSRLPDEWRPDETGLRYAVETLGPNVDPERELDRFRDYWRAVPGAKARKADWPATWRNWCRNAADNLARRSPHARPSPDAKFDARQANHASHERGADLAARLYRES